MKRQTKLLTKATSNMLLKMKCLKSQSRMLTEMQKNHHNNSKKKRRKKVKKSQRNFFYVEECIKLEEIGFMKDSISVSMNTNSLI